MKPGLEWDQVGAYRIRRRLRLKGLGLNEPGGEWEAQETQDKPLIIERCHLTVYAPCSMASVAGVSCRCTIADRRPSGVGRGGSD
jgi:hypothetical protein